MSEGVRAARRRQTLADIRRIALEQLATSGAEGLSLRAIAREREMVSSAIYRYYASRDELITDLVIAAYTDLADHLARVASESPDHEVPLRAVAHGLRAWALAQPHRFALIYGTPIPGYVAPASTIPAAAGVFVAVAEAARVLSGPTATTATRESLTAQVEALLASGGLDWPDGEPPPPQAVSLAAAVVTAAVGLITLELNGQFVGSFEPAEPLLDHLLDTLVPGPGGPSPVPA